LEDPLLQFAQQVVLTVVTLEKVDGVTAGILQYTQKKEHFALTILLKYMTKILI